MGLILFLYNTTTLTIIRIYKDLVYPLGYKVDPVNILVHTFQKESLGENLEIL